MGLTIQTLATLRVTLDGRAIDERFRTDKERALLIYLALQPEHAQRRESLAELLWPDRPAGSARTNLRQALYGIRRGLEDSQADPPYLLISGDSLQLNLAAEVQIDALLFSGLIQYVKEHYHPQAPLCRECAQKLKQAVELYQGNFLEGMFLGESVAFQEWMMLQRERYQHDYLYGLELLCRYARQEKHDLWAVDLARRIVAANPLDESGHRQLMQSLAEAGKRGMALEHYQECRQILLEELGVEPSQETRELFEEIRDGGLVRRRKTGPLRRRSNLPGQLTAFVGRSQELDWFDVCLQKPVCRLITIAGMSGVGKTRLALEVCQQHVSQFEDGVWFVPVEGIQSTEQLVYSIGSTLGLHFDEMSSQRSQLISFLSPLETLVLLDGFEHMVPSTELLIDILQHAPDVKFMVTTRVRLEFQSACILELQGLEYPMDGVTAEAIRQPAVQLFISRAARAQPAFEANTITLPEVIRICKLVEGHPLAIELAASGLRARTCQQIAQEIQSSLDSLQTLQQDMPLRHRSFRAALDHAWQVLQENEREVLARLSVFSGTFTLSAAQEIAGGDIQMLSALVGKSLLLQDVVYRFRLQPLVRTYLDEILRSHPARYHRVHRKHSHYYLSFVHQRENGLVKGHNLCQLLTELGNEIEHIRQAWGYALQAENWGDLLLAVEGMKHYFDISSNLPEGQRWHAQVVEALMVPLLAEEQPPELAVLAGLSYQALGWFYLRQGRLAAAYEQLLESRSLLEGASPGDHPELYIRGRATTLSQLGFAAAALGDYAKANEFFQKSLVFALEVHDCLGEAYARLYLAEFVQDPQVDTEKARAFRSSLEVFTQVEDQRGAVRALIDLGDLAYQQGEWGRARRYYEAAGKRVGSLDTGWASAAILLKQAAVSQAQGDMEEAVAYTEKSLEIYQEIGDLRRVIAALNQLGGLYLARESFNQAAVYHEEALRMAIEIGAVPLALACLVEIGTGYSLSGGFEAARSLYQQVLAHPAAPTAESLRAARLLAALPAEGSAHSQEQTDPQAYLENAAIQKLVARFSAYSGSGVLASGDAGGGYLPPGSTGGLGLLH